MLTSAFLAQVRDVLHEPAPGKRWTDANIIRSGDQQVMGLVRTMMQGNGEWSNHTIGLQIADAVQPLQYCYEWRLPTWVMGVRRVWLKPNEVTAELSQSVYRWTPVGTAALGTELFKKSEANRNQYYEWTGNYSLRVCGLTSSTDIIMSVVKRPSRMGRMRLSTAPADTSSLYLPASLELGEIDLEEGIYSATGFQCITTNASSGLNYGEVRRAVHSDPNEIVTAVRRHTVWFDKAWLEILAAGDVLDTVVNIPDEHCRYLVLLTARACMQQLNAAGLDAIKGELSEEAAKFMTYAASTRDRRGPHRFKRRSSTQGRVLDRERPDFYWGW